MNPIERMICGWGFHQMVPIHRISGSAAHVGCTRCKREFGMNHDVMVILPWEDVSYLYSDPGLVPGGAIYVPDPAEVARRLNPANYARRTHAHPSLS